jgi:O-acetyl-ADP-ribose deacetylase (regulator of RNase III)
MQPTKLVVALADITAFDGDAIVNAANSSLLGGGGVDGAIHRAGGPQILDECRAIVARAGGCRPGSAVITGGGNLLVRFVIHAVGPIWTARDASLHVATLADAHRSSLDLAASHRVRRLAFPNISTGVYRFPKPLAADVALGAVSAWLDEHAGCHSITEITFSCFDRENAALYTRRLAV